ncbi:hypothetical protein GCM10023322_19040 [Rugosimonospora acidiphila]|uniref:FtsX-like permease family protein n=1 Tax=Rugosimonospora acidiphila TaxID=556531 RepID=A0ABP9RNG3_9ACTN
MLAVALCAIRARRTQAAALLVIAVLVTAAAVAAPFFVFAATSAVALHDVSSAPVPQRLVTASRQASVSDGDQVLTQYRAQIRQALKLPRFEQINGASVAGEILGPAGGASSPMAARDGVCAQVEVQGACPTGTGDAMLSVRTAAALGVRVGDRFQFAASSLSKPLKLRVTGLYQAKNPGGPYWGTGSLLAAAPPAQSQTNGLSGPPDAVFVSEKALVATRSTDVADSIDFIAGPGALDATRLEPVAQAVADGTSRLSAQEFDVHTGVPNLIDRVRSDQRLILLGVPLGTGELVLFGWFALFLAVTMGATARRADLGLVKLRGLAPRRIWILAGAQSALPVLAGVVPGALLGWVLARATAGAVQDRSQVLWAVLLAAGAAAVAVLGGLLAALVAERRTVRTGVVELLRRTPPRRRAGWRGRLTAVVDFALVMLALAGVYQVHAAANGQDVGLVVVAPGLVAFAAGLLAARLLVPVAARLAVRALRSGRLRGVLIATYLARRPGLERLFALMAVAVAVAGYAALAWDTSSAARHDRAAQELGADRVLTVEPVGAGRLLTAVRGADPSGRYAMAAIQASTQSGVPAVLAVDTTRLAAVAAWNPRYGVAPGRLAAELHPPAPPPVFVAAPRLALNATLNAAGGQPVYVVADVAAPDGRRMGLRYGPLRPGAHRYVADSPECVPRPGCRLDDFALAAVLGATGQPLTPPHAGLDLVLNAFAPAAADDGANADGTGTGGTGSGDPAPADVADFRNPARWRPTVSANAAGPVLAGAPGGLRISLPSDQQLTDLTQPNGQVYLVDAPTPVPVLLAGKLKDAGLAGDPVVDLFGSDSVPIRVAGRADVLPRLGASGALVDLDYADRLVDDGGGPVVSEVWLAPGAPASIVDRLRSAGLRVTGDDTISGRQARYGQEGTAIALRFQLLGAALAVILAAAGLVLAAAVERGPRSDELAALRTQGLTHRVARAVAFGGYAWLAGAALLAGLVVAPVDRLVTGAGAALPLFTDGWHVLPPPALLRPGGLLVAAALAAVLLGATAALGGRQLIRRVTR